MPTFKTEKDWFRWHRKLEREWAKSDRVNQSPAQIPSLAEVLLERLCAPGSDHTKLIEAERHRILAAAPDHWTVRLTRKLDVLVFEGLKRGAEEPSEGRGLGQLIEYLRAVTTPTHFAGIQQMLGPIMAKRLTKAFWGSENGFFAELAKGFACHATKTAKVYSFLLNNVAQVERCRTVAAIWNLPGRPAYTQQSFNRLCKNVGLPLRKRAKI